MGMNKARGNLRAVVFDVYGTLVEITDPRRPYAQLLNHLAEGGRPRQPSDGALIMSTAVDLAGAARLLDGALPAPTLAKLELDLAGELKSIQLFPEVIDTLQRLRERDILVGLCSNLAAPYAEPVQALLSSWIDVAVWSFECGHVKPEPAIYQEVCRGLNCRPGEVLMVGDTPHADVVGPARFGMASVLIDRRGRYPDRIALGSLSEVLNWLD